MKIYRLTMEIEVHDSKALIACAQHHAKGRGWTKPPAVTEVEDALVMLLDPAGGGDAYSGNLDAAGISVVASEAEGIWSDGVAA